MILWISVMVAGEIGLFMSLKMGFGEMYHLVAIALMFFGSMGAVICHRKIIDRVGMLERKVELIRRERKDES